MCLQGHRWTFFDADSLAALALAAGRIINAGCVDISKHRVGTVFAEVFGYDLDMDPTQYEGPMRYQIDLQLRHDGRVIQGPISTADIQPDRVYQKTIDNRSEREGMVVDWRTAIYGDRIPDGLSSSGARWTLRFTGPVHDGRSRLSRTRYLQKTELDRLRRLAKKMGVDYAELDVLRDSDGRIYVVDVNATPGRLPLTLPSPGKGRLV